MSSDGRGRSPLRSNAPIPGRSCSRILPVAALVTPLRDARGLPHFPKKQRERKKKATNSDTTGAAENKFAIFCSAPSRPGTHLRSSSLLLLRLELMRRDVQSSSGDRRRQSRQHETARDSCQERGECTHTRVGGSHTYSPLPTLPSLYLFVARNGGQLTVLANTKSFSFFLSRHTRHDKKNVLSCSLP